MKLVFCGLLALLLATTTFAGEYSDKNSTALKNAVILIIRHAEKPDDDAGLSPLGQQRAKLYVNYFKNFTVDSQPLTLDYLFSAADSKESRRPRLTIEPLSKATGLAIDSRFKDKQFSELAAEIRSRPHGRHILICWHHGEIPQLVRALGADPGQLFANAKWPGEVFGWVIQLRYDADGHLLEARRINENLLPDDADKAALKAP